MTSAIAKVAWKALAAQHLARRQLADFMLLFTNGSMPSLEK
jgi:hypothetical protein